LMWSKRYLGCPPLNLYFHNPDRPTIGSVTETPSGDVYGELERGPLKWIDDGLETGHYVVGPAEMIPVLNTFCLFDGVLASGIKLDVMSDENWRRPHQTELFPLNLWQSLLREMEEVRHPNTTVEAPVAKAARYGTPPQAAVDEPIPDTTSPMDIDQKPLPGAAPTSTRSTEASSEGIPKTLPFDTSAVAMTEMRSQSDLADPPGLVQVDTTADQSSGSVPRDSAATAVENRLPTGAGVATPGVSAMTDVPRAASTADTHLPAGAGAQSLPSGAPSPTGVSGDTIPDEEGPLPDLLGVWECMEKIPTGDLIQCIHDTELRIDAATKLRKAATDQRKFSQLRKLALRSQMLQQHLDRIGQELEIRPQ